MKTYATYGFYMSLASALLVFALYFMGFHSEASKLSTAQTIQMVCGFAIGTTFIVLGIKARRAEVPAIEDFGYGRALGTGVMITLFAALFGTIFNYLYSAVINPNYVEVMLQAQTMKFEEKGMSGEQIDRAIGMMRGMMKPAIQAAFGFIAGMFFGTLISLVAAAFLKRPATDEVVAA
jgi:hypothetical protein